jgi:3-phenylpropionate/cinnamic acid dioxygenase small subunit
MNQNVFKENLGKGVVIEAIESMTGAESIAPDHLGRGRLPSSGYTPKPIAVDALTLTEVQNLLFLQAAHLDAKNWSAWIDMFASDGVYWMPSKPEQTDWKTQPSIFAEDALIMEIRMARITHPNAWSQAPMWATNHMVGNVMIEEHGPQHLEVYSRFQMMELRRDDVRHFAGSYRHTLVRESNAWKIKLQRVDMINAQAAFDYVLQAWV